MAAVSLHVKESAWRLSSAYVPVQETAAAEVCKILTGTG